MPEIDSDYWRMGRILSQVLVKAWSLFHRLKVPFLLIFFSVNYTFLARYGYRGDIWLLLFTFTVQNCGLHLLNNVFDMREDMLTGQGVVLQNRLILLIGGVASTALSLYLVILHRFSLVCFSLLFVAMFIYSVPLTAKFRLKQVLYMKNLAGSIFWWYLPFTLIAASHTDTGFWKIAGENTITLAIFMPFEPLWDIKDAEGDRIAGIETIPNVFGLAATKLLVVAIFLIIAVIKAGSIMFVVSFLLPIIVMVLMISENNKLVVSQFLMLFTALHTFGANVVMPILQNIWQK